MILNTLTNPIENTQESRGHLDRLNKLRVGSSPNSNTQESQPEQIQDDQNISFEPAEINVDVQLLPEIPVQNVFDEMPITISEEPSFSFSQEEILPEINPVAQFPVEQIVQEQIILPRVEKQTPVEQSTPVEKKQEEQQAKPVEPVIAATQDPAQQATKPKEITPISILKADKKGIVSGAHNFEKLLLEKRN
jgi:hypothetical protein